MSQPPRNKPPTRQVPTRSSGSSGSAGTTGGSGSSGGYSDRGSGGRNSGGSYSDRGTRNGGRSGGSSNYGGPNRGYAPPPPRGYRNDPRYAPPPRDPFPYIMGGIIGALVVGLALVALLLLGNKGSTGNVPLLSPTTAAGASGTSGSSTDPPRMSMGDFKALYDNPAKRPTIIDVRALQSFNEGHISGAISFPEAEVDTRISEIPKDKLVVAYCQWPAENESARVAQKLHDTYGYSYDNLKVLLGGWNAWKDKNGTDPKGYPIVVISTPVPPGATGNGGIVVTSTVVLGPAPTAKP